MALRSADKPRRQLEKSWSRSAMATSLPQPTFHGVELELLLPGQFRSLMVRFCTLSEILKLCSNSREAVFTRDKTCWRI
jgi:hypothetical protein